MTWDDALALSRKTSAHYGLTEEQRFFAYRMASELRPGAVIVELGVCNAPTSIVFAYVAKHLGLAYHGVDAFILENTAAQFQAIMAALELPYTLHVGYTNSIHWDTPIDLLLIDADHHDPFVDQDCARWLPFLVPGGIAMFHDYDAAPEPIGPHWPVRSAVDRHTQYWPVLYYIGNGTLPDGSIGGIDGLVIKRKPPPGAPIHRVNSVSATPSPGSQVVINGEGVWHIVGSDDAGRWEVVRNHYQEHPYWLWYEGGWCMQRKNA
jgi:hypothetical protein